MDRAQIEKFVIGTLGVLTLFLGKIPWLGSILVALVSDPKVVTYIVDRLVAVFTTLGDNVPTTVGAFAQAASDGGYQAAPGDAAINDYVRQCETALRAAGAK